MLRVDSDPTRYSLALARACGGSSGGQRVEHRPFLCSWLACRWRGETAKELCAHEQAAHEPYASLFDELLSRRYSAGRYPEEF